MRWLLVLAALLWSEVSWGSELHLLELRDLNMDYMKIANNRDPYFGDIADPVRADEREHWDYGVAVNFDLEMIRYGDVAFHWSNKIHGEATNSQFREVGWQFRWGMEITEKVELFYDHHSRHSMELDPGEGHRRFPLFNSYGVTFTFYKRD